MCPAIESSDLGQTDKENTPSLPVRTPEGLIVGWLEPVSSANAHRPEIISSIYRWRKENMTRFLTVFEPSQEKTRHYVDKIYLPDVELILFFIRERNLLIGHIGFKNLGTSEPELYNVLRGERCEVAGLMHLSQIAALAGAFGRPGIESVVLEVLHQNERAIRAYKKIGFKPSTVVDLVRVPIEGGYVLTPTTGSQRDSSNEQLLKMKIVRNAFVQAYGWALA
jgi:RimJ/RimL family protein N-acetyltransferase